LEKSMISYLGISNFPHFSQQRLTTLLINRKRVQWHHWRVGTALCDINKNAFEIGEHQNRCHNDIWSVCLSFSSS